MPSVVPCPSADCLQRFLLGDLPVEEGEQIAPHLERCPRCLAALQRLQRDDVLVAALRKGGPGPAEAADARVDALIDRVRHLRAWGHDAATGGDQADTLLPPAAAARDPLTGGPTLPPAEERVAPPAARLDFLAPPQGPGEIGRLGDYRVLDVLGEGGMGVVLRAEDPGLRRLVALKVMRSGLAANDDARERFLREARAAAALRHEHVVTIYQVGQDRGVPFLAMEFLPGQSLEERLHAAPLTTAEVLRIGREVAEGLAAAHEVGLIHRDIKPANIWLENRAQTSSNGGQTASTSLLPPRVKILDFGLARAMRQQSGLTQVGVVLGTPGYMAPEQADGRAVDGRSDLFSLGCVLYQACTGQKPFRGKDLISTLMAAAVKDPPPPQQVQPGVPAGLSALVMRLLAKNPEQRPATAREVADTLAALAAPPPLAPPPRRTGQLLAAALLVGVLGVASGTYGPAVFRFITDRGQLVIHTDDPDVQVNVKQNSQTVEIVDLKTKKSITLRSGDYDLELADAGGGLKLTAQRVTLRRGGKVVVEVRREAAPVAGPPAAPGKPELIRTLAGHAGTVMALAFAPGDYRLASGGRDQAIRIWEPDTGKILGRLDEAPFAVCALAFAQGGEVLFGGGDRDSPGDGSVQAWAPGEQRPRRRRAGHGDNVTGLAVLPAQHLALSADRAVHVWELETGREVGKFEGHGGYGANAVAVSADGRVAASGGSDNAVRLWEVATRRQLQCFKGHTSAVKGVAVSADGRRVLSGSWDRTVRLWDADTGEPVFDPLTGHTDWVNGVALSPDGRLAASAGKDHTVRVWDLVTGKERFCLEEPKNAVEAVAFSHDGRLLAAAGRDKVIRVWRMP
jgi:serine/threonine protein kinase/WD40 repeat protein